jgi:hypothetical protein
MHQRASYASQASFAATKLGGAVARHLRGLGKRGNSVCR